jgi:hypothetical protein
VSGRVHVRHRALDVACARLIEALGVDRFKITVSRSFIGA